MCQSKLSRSDLAIAKQRIECAISAFGGTVARKQLYKPQPNKLSIFRRTDTSSSTSTSDKTLSHSNTKKSRQRELKRSNSLARREKYENKLRQQYFEHGNRLSWDVQSNLKLTLNGARTFDEDDSGLKRMGSTDSGSGRKNRCKKCGQIKMGHVCPFASSLQRSIGVMVYPSANAFVANEPGKLAPALCEMNNFISIKSSSYDERSKEGLCGVITPAKKETTKNNNASPLRRRTLVTPPTTDSKVADENRSDKEEEREGDKPDEGGDEQGCSKDLLFQPKMEITLDQYRTVTPKDPSVSRGDYKYPQVPLTFTQRKSMSDALFSLSKLVPKLTDECALVLTEARKYDQWDQAVAELMVQVVCVLHCGSAKDYTLQGLRRYLMTLGIVC